MPLICQFITSRRQEFGVVPICHALSVRGGASAYLEHLARQDALQEAATSAAR